ncbi:hypothetical protein DGG96_03670 [Legionella qingyii]|uniref:Uncharacterized protein n=1 Tax=Legionella qingyii TaxID=2184757 RepID=A0A317U8S7_9GAMM|nr:hypothetical protein DGG96_03670 [Legionella qingyii]
MDVCIILYKTVSNKVVAVKSIHIAVDLAVKGSEIGTNSIDVVIGSKNIHSLVAVAPDEARHGVVTT